MILLVLGIALLVVGQLLRVRLLNAITRPFCVIGVRQAMFGYSIGFALNVLIPLRVGDLVRALMLAKTAGASRTVLLLSAAIERSLDLLALGAIAAMSPVADRDFDLNVFLFVCAAIVAAAAAVMITSRVLPSRVVRACVLRLTTRAPKRVRLSLVGGALVGQRFLARTRPSCLARAAFYSAMSWAFYGVGMWLISRGGGLSSATDWINWNVVQIIGGGVSEPFTALSAEYRRTTALLAVPLFVIGIVAAIIGGHWGRIGHAVRGGERIDASRGSNPTFRLAGVDVSAFLPGLAPVQTQLRAATREQNIRSVRSLPGGSGALVILHEAANRPLVRKMVTGRDSTKLSEQREFLIANSSRYHFPQVVASGDDDHVSWFDLEYLADDVSGDRWLTDPARTDSEVAQFVRSWIDLVYRGAGVLDRVSNEHGVMALQNIWATKINPTLALLDDFAPELSLPSKLTVNGSEFATLRVQLVRLWSASDRYAPTMVTARNHGDPTLSNLFVASGHLVSEPGNLRLIDPNPRQPVTTLEVDLGKILQSLWGEYEWLLAIRRGDWAYDGESLSIGQRAPAVLATALNAFDAEILRRWDQEVLDAARLQCIIHHVRLLPYRLAFDRSRLPLFYCRTLELCQDLARSAPNGCWPRNA